MGSEAACPRLPAQPKFVIAPIGTLWCLCASISHGFATFSRDAASRSRSPMVQVFRSLRLMNHEQYPAVREVIFASGCPLRSAPTEEKVNLKLLCSERDAKSGWDLPRHQAFPANPRVGIRRQRGRGAVHRGGPLLLSVTIGHGGSGCLQKETLERWRLPPIG